MVQPVKLVYCYARSDEVALRKLRNQLKPLERMALIQTWFDRQIEPGTDYHRGIERHLDEAQLIILLISADFLASDYCYSREMKQALMREKDGKTWVLPIIVHPCLWEDTPISHLQALPRDSKPVNEWSNKHRTWQSVAQDIREIALILQKQTEGDNQEESIHQEDAAFLQQIPDSSGKTGAEGDIGTRVWTSCFSNESRFRCSPGMEQTLPCTLPLRCAQRLTSNTHQDQFVAQSVGKSNLSEARKVLHPNRAGPSPKAHYRYSKNQSGSSTPRMRAGRARKDW
jgi:hypothetical protein